MKRHSLFLIVLFIVSLAIAQPPQTGKITGSIMDASTNEPLIRATVLVLGTNLGAASDLDGNYMIDKVPVGTHSLQVNLLGYKSVIIPDVTVTAVKPTDVDIALRQNPLELQGVTVKPNFFEQVPDKLLSTQSQSNAEIRRLPGGLEDVVRAISILPGVAQVQNGRNDLIVRGGAPSENLYVVDGIEVPNINHFGTQGATGGPLSFINLDFVENTTFSSGGFGVRYGDKLSSVTRIDLRHGRQDRWGGKATISATQFGLNVEGPLSDRGGVIFSARRSYLDFIFKAAGFAFVPEYWDFMIKANYDLNERNRLTVLGLSAINNVKQFNDTAEKRYNNSRILSSDQYQAVSGLTWRRLLHKGFSTVTLSQIFFRFDQMQSDTLRHPLFSNASKEIETALTANLLWRLSAGTEATIGLQAKQIRFNSDLYLPPLQTDFGSLVSSQSAADTVAYKAAGWLQLEQRIKRVSITLGGRWNYFGWLQDKSFFEPRLGLRYELSNLTRLNASVGRYSQSPSYIWLTANAANQNLKFMAVNQYILGMEQLLRDDVKLSLEGYYKDYSDYPTSTARPYLIMANTGAGFGGAEEGFASFGVDPLISGGSGYARGVELFIQKKTSAIPHYGLLSISYNQSAFKALDGKSRPSSFDQRWIVNFGGGYIFNSKWEVSGKFRLATGRPYTPYGVDLTKFSAEYNSMRLRVNHALDLRVDRRWALSGWSIITYLDIQNIYNRPYYDVPRYNSYKGKFEETSSIGILPSIGISAEF
jgi:hypothetical protein